MAYSGSMSRRDADYVYTPRQAWVGTYNVRRPPSQFSSETTGATAEPEDNSSRGRGVRHEKEYQNMDTDDTDSTDTSMFRKTMELITKMEDLKQLLEQSKDEIKAADKLKQKPNHDTEIPRASITGIEYQKDENRKLENEIGKLKEEKSELNNQLKKKDSELQKIMQNIEENVSDQVRKVSDENKTLSGEIKRLNNENEKYKKEYEKLIHDYRHELDRRNELEQQSIKQHQADMATVAQECENVKLQLSQSHKKYKTVEDEKKKLEQELEESKTRLSRLMGNKLADNNPDIADLSDKNRPTKIAEKYAELYDNEWTDAFETFEEAFNNEQKSIQKLLLVLVDIKEHCDQMAQDQAASLKTAVIMHGNKDGQIPDYVQKQLKDLRRLTAEVSFPEVYQSYIAKLNNSTRRTIVKLISDERVQPFVKGCLELCWLMTVQDPPLLFGPKPQAGDVFDTSVYKHYTQTGAFIEFLVWPTLLLHEGGAMLSKGVAQGYGRVQSAPNKPISRERRRNDTAAAIRESADNRPQTAPPAQNIDRDDKGKIYQTSASASPVNTHLQSQHDQNYQQQVVTGKTRSSNSQFSSTVRDTTGKHSGNNLHSYRSSSVRHGSDIHRSQVPVHPGYDAMGTFYHLRRLFGADSKELKDQLGNKYYDCLNYYNNLYKKT